MAFGFPASFKTEIEVTGSRQVIRDAIRRTFDLLSWNYTVDDAEMQFTAKVPVSFSSYGEYLLVSLVSEPVLSIHSSCKPIQLFDWGKNRANVGKFVETLLPRLSYFAAMAGPPPTYLDESGRTPVERIIDHPAVQASDVRSTDDQLDRHSS